MNKNTNQTWLENESLPTNSAPNELKNEISPIINDVETSLEKNVCKGTGKPRKKRLNDWAEDEDSVLIQEYDGTPSSINKLCRELNKTRLQIKRRACKLGIAKKHEKKSEYTSFLIENYKNKGARWCAEKLNLSYSTIGVYASNLGLKLTPEEKSTIISAFDASEFIKADTKEKCYILGLLWADGHVSKEDAKCKFRINLTLVKEDFETIKTTAEKSGNWSFSVRSPDNRQVVTVMTATNISLWKWLNKYDFIVKSGASAIKILNEIPEHLKHYFWRGYFDGDGWFNFKPGLKYSMGLSSCLNQNWGFVEDLFDKLEIKYYISKRETKSGNSSQVCCGNFKGTKSFAEYIYQGYEQDKIGLTRKYNKWKDMELVKSTMLKGFQHKYGKK